MKKKIFYGDVPQKIKNATRWNMKRYCMDLADAFDEACRRYAPDGSELYHAWYETDYRRFIPSAYRPEYLDFSKHPLRYQAWLDRQNRGDD